MDGEKIIKYLTKRIGQIAKKYDFIYVIIYGSLVEGRYVEGESDIDIAIKIKNAPRGGKNIFKLLANLVSDIGIDNIDIIILNNCDPIIRFEVLINGVLIYCIDEEEYYSDVIKSLKWYDDWRYIEKSFMERELKWVKS